jgi:hypothetical protein
MTKHTKHDAQWAEEMSLILTSRILEQKIVFTREAIRICNTLKGKQVDVDQFLDDTRYPVYKICVEKISMDVWSNQMQKAHALVAELGSLKDLIDSHFTEQDLKGIGLDD